MIVSQRAPQQLGAMEQLEEELTCPVCCALFEDPRVLLCSHSFCKKCLEALLEAGRGPAFRTPLKCPTCRKETPHNGANSLQVNYTLRGIVEKFGRIKAAPQTSGCERHPGQPLNMFCATDSRLICGFCATADEHRGHGFSSLREAHELERESFAKLQWEAKSWCGVETLSRLETLQARKKKALQAVSRDAEEVADYFDVLVASLECKRSEILADLETLKLAVMQAYDPEIYRLSEALQEQSRALGLAETLKSVSEPLRFLQGMQEFRERVKILKETAQPSRKEADVGPVVRNFDVKKWDSVQLGEIDKMSVPQQTGSTARRRLITSSLIFLLLLATLSILFNTALDVTSECLPNSALFLQGATDMCTGWMDTGQGYVMRLISAISTTFTQLAK